MENNNKRFSLRKDWKLINFCEFDKYATKSYCAIHGVDENLNLGDITKVDETKLESFNMICGGSPCQDFSVAGKQKGSVWTCKDCGHEYNPLTVHWSQRNKCPHCSSENIEKTRSSLLVEYLRVIRANKPNFGMYENVKNIVGKQFKDTTFKLFEDELHEYGYNTYWKVLNAKDFGVPQNRERVYLIFIKKDLDNGKFVFPEGFDNGIRLKDVLEDEVDEKYYISNDKVQEFLKGINIYFDESVNKNIIRHVGKINSSQDGVIVSDKGISPTHTAGHGNMPKVLQAVNTEFDGTCRTIKAQYYKTSLANYKRTGDMGATGVTNGIAIRKLTPKECFRLMGFSDSAYEAASKFVSNSQLYKQSGNSIVVDVLYYILVELYEAMPYLFDNLKLSSFFSGIGAFEVALDRLYESINTGNFIDSINNRNDCTNKVFNPLKNKSPYGWHFEQEVYDSKGIVRALKAGGGSGNIPKVILNELNNNDYYYTVEDGKENCIDKFNDYETAYDFFLKHDIAQELFLFNRKTDELIGCLYSKGNFTKPQVE